MCVILSPLLSPPPPQMALPFYHCDNKLSQTSNSKFEIIQKCQNHLQLTHEDMSSLQETSPHFVRGKRVKAH